MWAQREEELVCGASYAPFVTFSSILIKEQGFLPSILSLCNVKSLILMKYEVFAYVYVLGFVWLKEWLIFVCGGYWGLYCHIGLTHIAFMCW